MPSSSRSCSCFSLRTLRKSETSDEATESLRGGCTGTFSSWCFAFATIASLASNSAQISAHPFDAAADLLDARCIRDAHEAVAALPEGDSGDHQHRRIRRQRLRKVRTPAERHGGEGVE